MSGGWWTARALGRRLRLISRTLARRTGERKAEVLALTEQAGRLLSRSIREARQLAVAARRRARGRGARAKLAAIERLEEMTDRAQRVATQIQQRLAGEAITDRLVSMFDPDARPIRKGKLGKPNEFGYVTQLAEVTENTRRGARGFILPPSMVVGNPQEHTLLPATTSELDRLGLRPREVALDGGFQGPLIEQALNGLAPHRVFIAGRQQPWSRRTQRRLARYRVGAEGRISHLKREYRLDRSRLKGEHGTRAWNAWAIATYNLDTLAIRTS
jgi:IS5 family transposase